MVFKLYQKEKLCAYYINILKKILDLSFIFLFMLMKYSWLKEMYNVYKLIRL